MLDWAAGVPYKGRAPPPIAPGWTCDTGLAAIGDDAPAPDNAGAVLVGIADGKWIRWP